MFGGLGEWGGWDSHTGVIFGRGREEAAGRF